MQKYYSMYLQITDGFKHLNHFKSNIHFTLARRFAQVKTSGDITVCLAEVWADICCSVLSFSCLCFVHVLKFFFLFECVHAIIVFLNIKKHQKNNNRICTIVENNIEKAKHLSELQQNVRKYEYPNQ